MGTSVYQEACEKLLSIILLNLILFMNVNHSSTKLECMKYKMSCKLKPVVLALEKQQKTCVLEYIYIYIYIYIYMCVHIII